MHTFEIETEPCGMSQFIIKEHKKDAKLSRWTIIINHIIIELDDFTRIAN